MQQENCKHFMMAKQRAQSERVESGEHANAHMNSGTWEITYYVFVRVYIVFTRA